MENEIMVSILCTAYNHEAYIAQTLDSFLMQETDFAYEILVNGADVSTMPIEYAPQFTKKYNAANCEALNITVPSDYVVIE